MNPVLHLVLDFADALPDKFLYYIRVLIYAIYIYTSMKYFHEFPIQIIWLQIF